MTGPEITSKIASNKCPYRLVSIYLMFLRSAANSILITHRQPSLAGPFNFEMDANGIERLTQIGRLTTQSISKANCLTTSRLDVHLIDGKGPACTNQNNIARCVA